VAGALHLSSCPPPPSGKTTLPRCSRVLRTAPLPSLRLDAIAPRLEQDEDKDGKTGREKMEQTNRGEKERKEGRKRKIKGGRTRGLSTWLPVCLIFSTVGSDKRLAGVTGSWAPPGNRCRTLRVPCGSGWCRSTCQEVRVVRGNGLCVSEVHARDGQDWSPEIGNASQWMRAALRGTADRTAGGAPGARKGVRTRGQSSSLGQRGELGYGLGRRAAWDPRVSFVGFHAKRG
jgi:hypothetical protein